MSLLGKGTIQLGNSCFFAKVSSLKQKNLQTRRERGQRLSGVKKKQLLPMVLELQPLVSHAQQKNRSFAFLALSKFFCIFTGILEAY